MQLPSARKDTSARSIIGQVDAKGYELSGCRVEAPGWIGRHIFSLIFLPQNLVHICAFGLDPIICRLTWAVGLRSGFAHIGFAQGVLCIR